MPVRGDLGHGLAYRPSRAENYYPSRIFPGAHGMGNQYHPFGVLDSTSGSYSTHDSPYYLNGRNNFEDVVPGYRPEVDRRFYGNLPQSAERGVYGRFGQFDEDWETYRDQPLSTYI